MVSKTATEVANLALQRYGFLLFAATNGILNVFRVLDVAICRPVSIRVLGSRAQRCVKTGFMSQKNFRNWHSLPKLAFVQYQSDASSTNIAC